MNGAVAAPPRRGDLELRPACTQTAVAAFVPRRPSKDEPTDTAETIPARIAAEITTPERTLGEHPSVWKIRAFAITPGYGRRCERASSRPARRARSGVHVARLRMFLIAATSMVVALTVSLLGPPP